MCVAYLLLDPEDRGIESGPLLIFFSPELDNTKIIIDYQLFSR
jgi:hypothetical protein